MKKRTNVVIDEGKIKLAKKAYDIVSTKDLIDFAVDQLLRAKSKEHILKIRGKVKIDLDLDDSRANR